MFDLSLEVLGVVEDAAIASARTMGMGDRDGADQAAVESMRTSLETIAIDGTIVIGEGERDQAPMLYIGEKVGSPKTSPAPTRWILRSIRWKEPTCAPPARAAPLPCWRRPRKAACCTRRIATWRRSSSGRSQRRRRSGRAGEAEPESHRAAAAARRGRPGRGGSRPAAAREAHRRHSRSGRAHPSDLAMAIFRPALPRRSPAPACTP